MSSLEFRAQLPKKLQFLFQPARYKVLYGGRGGTKSWGIARALLSLGTVKPLRILCARELQRSIEDSVHQLLKDQISLLGMNGFYEVQRTSIKGANGTEFQFCGLRHNATELKSHEGADICWVEEANTVSKSSWEILIPTIRKDDSEIWVSFNPELDTDETYTRFVLDPPPNSVVVKVGYQDNPWLNDVLRQEMETLKSKDYDSFLTVWEGNPRKILEGSIYAAELRAAMEEGRIKRVSYNPAKPVNTYWDLGWADHVAIWFAQAFPGEFHVIDYHEDSMKKISDYLLVLQGKRYVYGEDWLPHDGDHKLLAADGRSIRQIMTAAGRRVRIAPNFGIDIGIKATREMFPLCYFDEQRCADGLSRLRRYVWQKNQATGQYMKTPKHDENSHGADAFRTMGVSIATPKLEKQKQEKRQHQNYGSTGWMGA